MGFPFSWDREQIHFQCSAAWIKPPRIANQSKEALLGDVLSGVLPPRKTVREAVNRLVVLIKCVFGSHVTRPLLPPMWLKDTGGPEILIVLSCG
jgi:hypothetical protein